MVNQIGGPETCSGDSISSDSTHLIYLIFKQFFMEINFIRSIDNLLCNKLNDTILKSSIITDSANAIRKHQPMRHQVQNRIPR